ncbi:MAG: GNAT family N-acetyltransferase, partial [Comamonas sp.]
HHIHVIDIALLPNFQSRGLGTALMEAVMQSARAQGKGVRLRVSRHNRAMDWYGRLGFHATDTDAMDVEMLYPMDAVALGIAG